ncbi:MAG: HEAT repeat domain-containing protein [Planctomycetia bacterium]|nr:HEAT repeat domain-containing protein [Planctomycetia bacterium]
MRGRDHGILGTTGARGRGAATRHERARRSPRAAAWGAALAAILGIVMTGATGRHDAAAGPDGDLVADLDHPDPERREQALVGLAALGKDRAREGRVVKLLADPDWGVAIEATRTLAKIGAQPACDALAAAAVSGEIVALRAAAADAAASVDPARATSRWLHLANAEKTPAAKVAALRAVARVATGASLKAIRPFTKHTDPRVEAAAIGALGSLWRDPAARDDVLDFLTDACAARREERKRFLAYCAAVDALLAIDDPRARAVLAAEVASLPDDDDYVPSRVAAVLAKAPADVVDAVQAAAPRVKGDVATRRWARFVRRLPHAGVRPHLVAALASKDVLTRTEAVVGLGATKDAALVPTVEPLLADESPEVRREAVGALARLEPASAFLARAEAVRADRAEEVRLEYVVALFDANDPAAIPVLEASFADPAWRVACAALAAAGALGVGADLPRFEAYLAHKDWRQRAAAHEALGRLRAVEAIPRLAAGLDDKDPVVRGVCWTNLQVLSTQRLTPSKAAWMTWYEAKGRNLALVKKSRRDAAAAAPTTPSDGPGTGPGYRCRKDVEVMQKARILVVTGAWDHVENVLEHLRIPHTVLRAQQVDEVGLNPNQVVLVNCEGNVDSKSAERLKWFTTVGGYVISTDWAVTKAVASCFPGHIVQYSSSSTGNDVVDVEPSPVPHPFVAGVFDGVPSLSWWLEIQAFPLTVARPHRVETLVDSREMRWKYGSSPLATTFRFGLGKVTHAISHFYLQEEGLAAASTPRDRMVFAADRLGIPIPEIRELVAQGRFPGKLDESVMRQLAPSYSMFRVLVNVVGEKSRWVENL